MITFTKVNGDFGWMSNMSDHKIEFQGNTFPRAEHWFICSRFGFDPKIVARICNTNNPIEAKIFSKKIMAESPELVKVKMLSQEDVDNMKILVQMKIEQHPWIKWSLMKTGDQPIIEDVTKRVNINDSSLFWGAAQMCCDNQNCESHWVGINMLGNIWMEEREKLIHNFIYNECSKSSEEFGLKYMKHKDSGEIVLREEVVDKHFHEILIEKVFNKMFP